MAQVHRQLAPGFGDLLPGNFVVPSNPLHPASGVRIPHLAELLPAKFAVPENPLTQALLAISPEKACSAGLGCPGSGMSGLGAFDLTEIKTKLTTWANTADWKTWAMVGGGVIVVYFLMTQSGGDRSAYRRELSQLKAKYPSRGRRMYRAAQSY
jgi:hypothetical protein